MPRQHRHRPAAVMRGSDMALAALTSVVWGFAFPAIRYLGMALILAGLAVILLPGAKPPLQTEPFA